MTGERAWRSGNSSWRYEKHLVPLGRTIPQTMKAQLDTDYLTWLEHFQA